MAFQYPFVILYASLGEGTSYTEEANAETFDNVSAFGMPSSTAVDADHIDSTFQMRKLDALRQLKYGSQPYIKYPSGSIPLSTRKNPDLYGQFFPIWCWYDGEQYGAVE